MDALKEMEPLASLIRTAETQNKSIEECLALIKRQTAMFDPAFNLLVALGTEEETPIPIRRRIVFALQQIRGAASPS